jgi:hypothetical protein
MTATPTTFPSLITQNNANIRKALKGGVLGAPSTASVPTALTIMSSGDTPVPVLQTLSGFASLGFFDDTGAVFSRKRSTQDVTAWGKTVPVRTDVTSDVTSVKVTALESNATVLSTFFEIPLADLVPDETTGELWITENISPPGVTYRILVLGQDGPAGSETWIGRLMPAATITALGDMSLNSGKDTIEYSMTLEALEDPVAGYAIATIFAGPGWLANLTNAGLSA